MAFSLRWLFALVLVAAIFTAGLVYRTSLSTFVAVNLGVIVLLTATTGVLLGRLNRTFWLPFCVFGWFYFLSSLNPGSISVLNRYSPGYQISEMVTSTDKYARPSMIGVTEEVARRRARDFEERAVSLRHFEEVSNMCLALIAGGLAGIVASLLIRQKPEK
ncbi:MAG: hypothetical protein WD894_25425 [Pirellulales bacterium]